MARFNIACGNHGNSPVQIEDLVVYLQLALLECGHTVDIGRSINANAHNILIECFNDPTAESVANAAKSGIKVYLLCTELITNGSFNNFGNNDDSEGIYGMRHVWDKRFNNFLKVAEFCQAIWYVTKEQRDDYAKVLPGKKLFKLPIGYLEGYAQIEKRPDNLKNIDFLFSGEVTKRRLNILTALKQLGFSVEIYSPFTPTYMRSNLVGRTKISLGLKQFDDWKVPSVIRSYYYLMAQSYFISEEYGVPSELDPYLNVVASPQLIETCKAAISNGNFSKHAAVMLDKFRTEVPLKPMFSQFLANNTI